MRKISIIIPAYNEEKTIAEIIKRVKAAPVFDLEKEIMVVDNNSTDRTLAIAKNIPDIKIFTEKEKGKGHAVKRGLKEASGDWLLIQDADLEYNPSDITKLLEKAVSQKTVVYGSRNLIPHRRGTFLARWGVWFLTKEFNFLFGTNLTDLWTCYKLFPKEAAKFFKGGGFDAELSFSTTLIKNGFKIEEVGISYNIPRTTAEGKKIRYRDGLWGILLLLVEKLK